MTRMTFLVGFSALPSAGVVVEVSAAGVAAVAAGLVASGAVASGSAGAVEAGFVACYSCSGSAAGSYSYTTSFLGFAVGFSVEGSFGESSSSLVLSLLS